MSHVRSKTTYGRKNKEKGEEGSVSTWRYAAVFHSLILNNAQGRSGVPCKGPDKGERETEDGGGGRLARGRKR